MTPDELEKHEKVTAREYERWRRAAVDAGSKITEWKDLDETIQQQWKAIFWPFFVFKEDQPAVVDPPKVKMETPVVDPITNKTEKSYGKR